MGKERILFEELDTPAVLLDLDILGANIKEMSDLAADAGINLRPHTKVHESAEIARMQMEAGACGIEVGPLAQADAFSEEGFYDIVVAHPDFYGGIRGEMLKKLLRKPNQKIAVVVDMLEQAESISRCGLDVRKSVPVIIKIDTNKEFDGISRFGVAPGKPALELAKKIQTLPRVDIKGLYAHEMGGKGTLEELALKNALRMEETAQLLRNAGIDLEDVAVGASCTFRQTCKLKKEGKISQITEIHPGSCVIGFMAYVMNGSNTKYSCALSVLASVKSTAKHPDAFIVDAGFKTFGAHSLEMNFPNKKALTCFGSVKGRPDLWVRQPFAETGMICYTDSKAEKFCLGERLEIVPINALPVINSHENLYGIRKGKMERLIPVSAREKGN